MIEVTADILQKIYKPRKPNVHKYDFGHLLVVGGSKLYHGSPALAGLAAYRSGVDLVTIVAPTRAANAIASLSPDLITYPIDCDYFTIKNLEEVCTHLKQKTAVVIGGGIEVNNESMKFILEFLEKVSLPAESAGLSAVLDAGAIHAVAKQKEVVSGKPFVLTPHAYESRVLSGIEVADNLDKRITTVQKIAEELKTTILLKGPIDVISDGEKIALNKTGNPYMSVGGTGDTLVGICGSLLAQGIETFDAACAGAFINGRAGDLTAAEFGQSLMASDLIEFIPSVVRPR